MALRHRILASSVRARCQRDYREKLESDGPAQQKRHRADVDDVAETASLVRPFDLSRRRASWAHAAAGLYGALRLRPVDDLQVGERAFSARWPGHHDEPPVRQ